MPPRGQPPPKPAPQPDPAPTTASADGGPTADATGAGDAKAEAAAAEGAPADAEQHAGTRVADAVQATKQNTLNAIKRKLEAGEGELPGDKRTRGTEPGSPHDGGSPASPQSDAADEAELAAQAEREEHERNVEAFKVGCALSFMYASLLFVSLPLQQMLREKNLTAYSTWDKTLPQLVFDARYKLLPSHAERRAVFDAFVRMGVEQDRAQKLQQAVKLKEAKAAYMALLEEHFVNYSDFKEYRHLRRKFKTHAALLDTALTDKDRQRLFDERRQSLKKQHTDDTARKHKQARTRFEELLARRFVERPELERTGDWTRIRRVLERDAETDTQLAECVAELKEGEREDLCRELLRTRRHSLRDQRQTVEQMLESSRSEARHTEAVRNFRVALQEKCRAPELSWGDARRLLDNDPRLRDTPLTSAEQQDLFHKHHAAVRDSSAADYRTLLQELTAQGEVCFVRTCANARVDVCACSAACAEHGVGEPEQGARTAERRPLQAPLGARARAAL